MDVIEKAANLMTYTFTVTSNRKRYPMKYIQLIKRIQNISMDIYESLLEANRIKIEENGKDRIFLQSKAITGCDKLSRLIEMSMSLNIIGSDTTEFWQTKINDVKYMSLSWRKKDKLKLS